MPGNLGIGMTSPRTRERLVQRLRDEGIRDQRVLDRIRNTPRHMFVDEALASRAYEDTALPIGKGQTISQPYIVAFMTEALHLEGGEKVLEIGTGSGYAAAVLAEIAAEVYTVERIAGLAEAATRVLEELGYDNVHVRHGDGTLGWPEEAPFDAIAVTAGGPRIPETLKQQLKAGGRLVIPVGKSSWMQQLLRVTRQANNEFATEDLIPVRFVPLIGEVGWGDQP